MLTVTQELAASEEILLWKTQSGAPKALQASGRSELFDPMIANFGVSALRQTGKFTRQLPCHYQRPVAIFMDHFFVKRLWAGIRAQPRKLQLRLFVLPSKNSWSCSMRLPVTLSGGVLFAS